MLIELTTRYLGLELALDDLDHMPRDLVRSACSAGALPRVGHFRV